MSMKTADGRKLSYHRTGTDGPVLVCHPGGPGFSAQYFGDLAGLWERFTLVLLNPRGTGGSSRPADPKAYRIDDYVSDLEELRVHLGLEKMLLLGHSHGGMVAQVYAARHPDRVEKLVLASTLARFGAEQKEAMNELMEKRSGQPWYADAMAALEAEQEGRFSTDEEMSDLLFRELPLYFAHFGAAEAGYLDTLKGEKLNGDALRLFNTEIFETFDLRGELGKIKAPTLVITGDDDFICGPVCADEVAAGIKGSRKVIVGDSGHMIFIEQPEAFESEVADFLQG
jgi:pimeloyl-ACP methyl ester carboxylesterase